MKIAVLSDTHDHIWNTEKVLKQIKNSKVKVIFHLGDIVAPFMSKLLSKANLPTYICLGNNDEDQIGLMQFSSKKFTWIPLLKEFGEVTLGGKKIAFCHYPKLAQLLAESGEYDAVFYGHTHTPRNERINKTLLLNPGAVCGILNGKPSCASYAIYDTTTNSAKIIEIN